MYCELHESDEGRCFVCCYHEQNREGEIYFLVSLSNFNFPFTCLSILYSSRVLSRLLSTNSLLSCLLSRRLSSLSSMKWVYSYLFGRVYFWFVIHPNQSSLTGWFRGREGTHDHILNACVSLVSSHRYWYAFFYIFFVRLPIHMPECWWTITLNWTSSFVNINVYSFLLQESPTR